MLASKSKGLFLEWGDFSILAAVTSSLDSPLMVESLKELPLDGDDDKVKAALGELIEVKGRSYVVARCGLSPKSRFVRRFTVEQPNKAKDPNFFTDVLSSQFRIDADKNSVAILSALDGTPFDLDKGVQNQKELLFVGASEGELEAAQERILGWGVYPDRLEIGSVATMGALQHYARWKKLEAPTLILEVSADAASVVILRAEQVDICRPIPYGLNSMFPVIQSELGLKDEDSARKLFYSNTFDFTEMGPVLLRRLLKELQASTGFYEVQTGQTIGQIFLPQLPRNLAWIGTSLSRALGVEVLHLEYPGWLKALGLTPGANVQLESLDSRWLGLFSLMGNFQTSEDGQKG